ncbi:CBS domain-containing protein [Streptomyces caeni]|uniref:CBS domain-containing protein n=1 Tax=Streptomyces caeni TaxID=2307231 RepID=A0ABW4IRY0_9ACTN
MTEHENFSSGAEARHTVPSHTWHPGEEARQDALLRYLGAVEAVSARHPGARRQPAPAPASRPEAEGTAARPPEPPAEPEGPLVRDVMEVPAASMRDDLVYRDIARLLAREHIGAIPVVDAEDRVIGVVSESDLLAKVAFEASGHRPGRIGRLRERRMHDKARGETAADLMTSPAITVLPGATVAEAAWLAALSRLKRLPVTDHDGRLVGVVHRNALLRALVRDDAAIREEAEARIHAVCSPADRAGVEVKVRDGVVELTGRMPRAAMLRLVAEVEGIDDVVEVDNHLTPV